mmetsp:Transcript_23594/g.44891  ORF Transcript_23594/g.44891 Transcript_23594/m.44891 type:complete len:316 (+) Transcript_23594:227-1174(+)
MPPSQLRKLSLCCDDPLDYSLPDQENRRRSARHYGAVFVCLNLLERWLELGIRPDRDLIAATSNAILLATESSSGTSRRRNANEVEYFSGRELKVRLMKLWNSPVENLTELKAVVRDTRRVLWQQAHLPAPDSHLRIGPSRIPGAQQGLFATQDLKAGTICCFYSGDVHSVASSQTLADASYVLRIGGGVARQPWWYEALLHDDDLSTDKQNEDCFKCYEALVLEWDALATTTSNAKELFVNPTDLDIKARYINDCLDEEQYNVVFSIDPVHERAAVMTLRRIRRGEELYVSYGQAYWDSLEAATGIVPRKLPRS